MKLIVWLWNPWIDYIKTRHNIGFLFLDWLIEEEDFVEFKEDAKFKWSTSVGFLKGEKVLLLKPYTYMNLSWESLRKVIDYYKIELDDIIVVYDDMSMDFWKIRFREEWSAWWHNWVKSINLHFWEKWKRVKIWIWFNDKYDVSDWVLSKFKKEELHELEKKVFSKAYDLLLEKM